MITLDEIARLLQAPRPELPELLGIEPQQLEALGPDVSWLATALPEGGVVQLLLPLGQTRVELMTVAHLQRLVTEKQRALQGRNLAEQLINPRAFVQVRDHASDTLRVLHELRTRAFGRVVLLRGVDTAAIRVYRIAQANLGFPEIGVLNRLAPLSQELVTAALGDEIEVGRQTLEVIGVANLERFIGNELTDREHDFRRMDLIHVELSEPALIEELARTLAEGLEQTKIALLAQASLGEAEARERRPVDRADTEGLGAHFYTRTTKLQEQLMQGPSSGVVIVIGVAGSGKTSVALGRTKVLCDRLGENDGEDEPGFFRPETAVGFVLNEQLRTYLERTCSMLMLFDMKVREYRDLREELLRTRHLDGLNLERVIGAVPHPLETTMLWVRAIDAEVAEYLATSITAALERPPAERDTARKQVAKRSEAQQEALEAIWTRLTRRVEDIAAWLRRDDRVDGALRVQGLARRIDDARDRFAKELEAHDAWIGPTNRELRQNVRNAVRERIIRALRLSDAYERALHSPTLIDGLCAAGLLQIEASAAVAGAASYYDAGRLSDSAIDVLLVLGHAISLGYAGRQDRDPISQLAQPSFYSQVFIDEYQDFNEVQIYLMAEQADPRRRAVTMVGDTRQQLRSVSRIDLKRSFPHTAPEDLVPAMLLENKRQTPVLARLSQRFREDILKDVPEEPLQFATTGTLPRVVRVDSDELHDAIEAEVIRFPREYSVAVICLSAQVARQLEREMRDRLTSRFRETRYSTHTDLVRRFFVHFTTPIDAKGLEFDAAVVPWTEVPDFSDPLMANGMYVAISRPRHRLSLVTPLETGEALGWIPEDFVEAVDGVDFPAVGLADD